MKGEDSEIQVHKGEWREGTCKEDGRIYIYVLIYSKLSSTRTHLLIYKHKDVTQIPEHAFQLL